MKSPDDKGEDWTYRMASDLDLTGPARMRSERREVGLVGASIHGVARLLTKAFLRLFLRFEIEGFENLPDNAPFVIAANHGSHLDGLVLAETLPARFTGRIFSLAAADYFFEKPSRTVFATQWVNALPLRRGGSAGKALGALRERLLGGDCIFLVFPEGSRSRDGTRSPFKAGIGMLVAETEVPVVPCHLAGTFEAWPPHRRFPRPGRVRIRFGEPEAFSDRENSRSGWIDIARSLEERVERLS